MKNISLLLVCFFFLLSCKKNDTGITNNNTNENLLSANSYIVDTAAIIGVTDNSITLLKSNTTLRPKVGDILISNPSINNPYGFLRKVISATENASQIVCNTEMSNLAEAFEQLTIDENYLDTFSSNRAFRTGAKLSVKFQNNITLVPGIRLNGELIFNIPSVQIQYKRIKGSLAPEKVLIKADFNTDGSTLEITKTDDASLQIGEKIVTDFNLPVIRIPIPVPTPVGVIIIQVPFAQKLVVKTLPLTITGKVKWTTLPKISATLGAKYETSTWSNLSTYTIDATAMPLSRLDFTPNISVTANVKFLTPEYDITPYAIDGLKAFFSIPNILDLTIQPFTTPNYSLKYKLDVTGGVKQDFYTGVKQEYSITGNVATQTILEGNWIKTIPSITTGNITSITQTTATSGGDILDDGGDAIVARGVCWSTSTNPTIANSKTNDGAGNASFVSNITGLSVNTTYFVRAYATNSVGTAYGNELSFTTGTGALSLNNTIWEGYYYSSMYPPNQQIPAYLKLIVSNNLNCIAGWSNAPGNYNAVSFNGAINNSGTSIIWNSNTTWQFDAPWSISGNTMTGVVKTCLTCNNISVYTFTLTKQ